MSCVCVNVLDVFVVFGTGSLTAMRGFTACVLCRFLCVLCFAFAICNFKLSFCLCCVSYVLCFCFVFVVYVNVCGVCLLFVIYVYARHFFQF